jgi:hypothetical protein
MDAYLRGETIISFRVAFRFIDPEFIAEYRVQIHTASQRFYRKTALFYLQAPGKVVLLDGECQLGTFGVIFGQYSEEYVCFPLVSSAVIPSGTE